MMIGPLLGLLVALALVVWLGKSVLDRGGRRSEAADSDAVDYEELEAAEREVRELGTFTRPDDEAPGSDWGPGTPRPPTRL